MYTIDNMFIFLLVRGKGSPTDTKQLKLLKDDTEIFK